MSFRPVALPPDVPGTLWLSAMPGRLEPWASFVAEARRAKLTQLVCLTPREELAELSPAYHAAVMQKRRALEGFMSQVSRLLWGIVGKKFVQASPM